MEEREDLTTQEMATQAEVTVRTVQRWLKSGKLKAEVLPHGKYRVNPFDLVGVTRLAGAEHTLSNGCSLQAALAQWVKRFR